MLVGVGYAAITGSLTIEGTASSGVQKFNVVFTKAVADEIYDSTDDGVVPTLSVQNTKLEQAGELAISNLFTVSMTATGLATTEDQVVVTYTIKNNNKVDMELTPTITGNSVFSVTGEFEGGAATTTVEAEKETTYKVTVKLANDGYDESKEELFTITIAGASVAP